jgi:alpha-beta hydrolase superfamily lysophospholipase
MSGSSSSFAGSEGKIFYRTWAPRERATHVVLVVHGYAEHSGRYEHVAAALTRRGAVVYAPDHLGHGYSEGERVLIRDFEHLVDDLRTLALLAAEAHPGLPMIVVGHGTGGMIAVRYAERYGDELAGLVLSGPVVGDWQLAREVLVLPELPGQAVEARALSRVPAVRQAYAEDPLVYHGPFRRETLQAFATTLERANADLGRVTVPVLHLHGLQDEWVPFEQVREALEHLPSAHFVQRLYEEARHELFNELEAEDVLDAVNDFIALVVRESPRR